MDIRLPKDILSQTYIKPNIFLCETDKTKICKLETSNTNISLKFNSYSELSFEVARNYNDNITGEIKVNPYFDKIEGLRLVEVEDVGYFEIQGPEHSSDGIKESKQITAYSLEYTLSQKYLEDFYTVNGRDEWDGSLEDQWRIMNNSEETPSIVLYAPNDPYRSLLNLMLEGVYGWSIGHVDEDLKSLSRDIDVDRESVYDFIMNTICEKFNCYAVFDTIKNEINFYAESLSFTTIGDGTTTDFIVSPPFSQVNTVSVGGYKTSQYEYDSDTATLKFTTPPENGEIIEVIDGAMEQWETDVFVTFDNLSQQVSVNYDAESIKTVLTVTYGEDGNIREVNNGLPYITDLSYYHSPDWMGQDLYDAYTAYLQKCNGYQKNFIENTKKRSELADRISYEETRLTLHPGIASIDHGDNPDNWTAGTYYIRNGEDPNYYYSEVTLPEDWKPDTVYYHMDTASLNETKVSNLYAVFQKYFNGDDSWETDIHNLIEDFQFMKDPTISELKESLKEVKDSEIVKKDEAILNFLNVMWDEVGRKGLEEIYLEEYKEIQAANMGMDEDGNEIVDGAGDKISDNWSQKGNANYWLYYPVTLMIKSIEDAITKRSETINGYQEQIKQLNDEISAAGEELLITNENNFTGEQLKRLSAFLREDELQLDDIVDTDLDDLNQLYKNKQDALESGRIELQKLSQPQLQFSMTMANIYALPEFEPIINQFKLGNVIKVGLRRGYVKKSRLLQIDMGLDDLSSFSCDFGELTNIKSQSDIHADLLKNAISAGKVVADGASVWNKGANLATKTDLKIKQGLLDATTKIKSIDGSQDVVIDKYGIHLQKKNSTTGELDPKQAWFINNSLLFTDDNWKTTKTGLGEFTVGGKSFYGLIAEAVIAGYIEGSEIVGGNIKATNINIGDGTFTVDGKTGLVSMFGAGHNIEGYATDQELENTKSEIKKINDTNKYDIQIIADGSTVITSPDDTTTLTCKVYSWDKDITDITDASLFYWRRTSATSYDFIGDGTTQEFMLIKDYKIGTVYVDGEQLKDTDYLFDIDTGKLAINIIPKEGSIIKVIDTEDLGWNNRHQGMKSIIITHNDVYENSGFICEVNL